MFGTHDNPLFVAADVCACLDIKNPRQAIARLEPEERGVISNDTLGGAQKLAVVTESGLYALVMTSRKPEAKAFKRWVTREVLPAIRKRTACPMSTAHSPHARCLEEDVHLLLRQCADLRRAIHGLNGGIRTFQIHAGGFHHTRSRQHWPVDGPCNASGKCDVLAAITPSRIASKISALYKASLEINEHRQEGKLS